MDCGEKFYNSYFDKTITDEKREFILNKKNQKIPPLFKYTNLNHIEELLCDDLMFLSPISNLNDPNEGVITYNVSYVLKKLNNYYKYFQDYTLNEKYFKYLEKNFLELINKIDINSIKSQMYYDYYKKFIEFYSNIYQNNEFNLNMIINSYIRNLTKLIIDSNFILSFSKRNNNNPLWNHYADGHRGICIEYDIKNCGIDFIKNNCFPIFYDDSDFSNEIKLLDRINAKFLLKPLLKKDSDWKYEQEWRIVLNQDLLLSEIDGYYCGYDNRNYIKFLKPKAVFMGKDILESDEVKIKEICQCRKIDLYKMEHKISQYKLTPKQINLDVENEGKNH